MKLANGLLGLVMLVAGSNAWPQADTAQLKVVTGPTVTRTFFLHNVSQASDTSEVTTALRNMVDANVKIYFVPSQNAIVMRAAPDQIALAQQVLDDLDKPKRVYRLTYTLTESDDGKRLGVQHSTVVLVSGQKTMLKNGSKVPIQTGTVKTAGTAEATMTYLDVGLNIDATLDESVNGVRLRSKVERSSVAEMQIVGGVSEPVIRQSVLEGASILTPGKPLMLGGFDFPGATRHMDVEVTMELVK